MDTVFHYSLLVVLCLMPVVYTFSVTDAGNLEDYLKTGYYTNIRPEEQTHIDVSYSLLHISSLDIVTQEIDVVGIVIMLWEDSRLQWTASSYGNINETTILQSDIWVPPVVLNNAADGLKILSDNGDTASNVATVSSTGYVTLGIPANFISQCAINIKYYPFDSQDCHIILTPWGYTDAQINLYVSDMDVIMDLYEENGEWDITEATVKNHSRIVGGSLLTAAKVTLLLQRKSTYYLLNLILPIILLAILGTFVFILPVESGEKNGFSLTILLSMSVMMTIVSDHIPPIATQTCQLSVYLLCVFIICSLETGITVFSCQIHAYTAKAYKPGERLQKLTAFMAKLTYYKRPGHRCDDTEATKHNDDVEKDIHVYVAKEPNGNEHHTEHHTAWQDNKTKDNELEKLGYTYEDLAFICDRFNFILFLVVTTVITIAVLASISVGGSR